MKVLIIISVVQFVLLSFVLVKQFKLEAKLAAAKSLTATPASKEASASATDQRAAQGLSEAQLRSVIRQELGALTVRQPNDTDPAGTSVADDEALDSDQTDRLEELGAHIDYLLSDGEFSAADMQEFENALAALPAGSRQQLLNKFAKSLKKSNTNVTR